MSIFKTKEDNRIEELKYEIKNLTRLVININSQISDIVKRLDILENILCSPISIAKLAQLKCDIDRNNKDLIEFHNKRIDKL